MGGEQPQHTPHTTRLSHQDAADHLPEYVAETLAGGRPQARYPLVAAHLAGCPPCRAELAELLALTRAAYDDRDERPATYPAPDLAGLRPTTPAEQGPQRLWSLDGLGRWLVELSADLLALGRPAPLAGLARAADLLYDLRVPPASAEAPELRVEVFDEPSGASVYLRASVDLPARDPLAMAGVEVTVAAGGGEWRALTDAVGTAGIGGIPRQALEGARIAIRAGRSA